MIPAEVNGITCELKPKINRILKIFEPTILPNANCVFFLHAATTEAANSGNEVPQAISVSEIIASLTPHDLAILTASSTNISQLTINTPRPTTTFTMANHNGVGFSVGISSLASVSPFFLSRVKEYHI